jgi:hypothetical protein
VSILGMPRLGRKGLGLIFILPLCKKILPKKLQATFVCLLYTKFLVSKKLISKNFVALVKICS